MSPRKSIKPVVWVGDSKHVLRSMPTDIQRQAGFELDSIQRGFDPSDWKPMPTIGKGVREIRIREVSGAVRVIYLATMKEAVYVLHVFQKTSQKTNLSDLRLAQIRFKNLRG